MAIMKAVMTKGILKMAASNEKRQWRNKRNNGVCGNIVAKWLINGAKMRRKRKASILLFNHENESEMTANAWQWRNIGGNLSVMKRKASMAGVNMPYQY